MNNREIYEAWIKDSGWNRLVVSYQTWCLWLKQKKPVKFQAEIQNYARDYASGYRAGYAAAKGDKK